MTTPKKTHYETLGVSETATDQEIQKRFRKLARECHPEGSNPDEARFKSISEAYEKLDSPTKRAEYDKELAGDRALKKLREEAAEKARRRQERARSQAETEAYVEGIRHQPETKQPTTPAPHAAPPEVVPSPREITRRLVSKLGTLIGALAFAAAPYGVMHLVIGNVESENPNWGLILVALLCIAWAFAGYVAVAKAVKNLFR